MFFYVVVVIFFVFVVSFFGIFVVVIMCLNVYFSYVFIIFFVNEISEMVLFVVNDGMLFYDSLGLSIFIVFSLKELLFILLMMLSVMF